MKVTLRYVALAGAFAGALSLAGAVVAPVYASSLPNPATRAALSAYNTQYFISCGNGCITGAQINAYNALAFQSAGQLVDSNAWTGVNTWAGVSNFTGSFQINGNTMMFPAAPATLLYSGVAAVETWLQTPTSANLAAAVPDKTGTGPLVFGIAPTITLPNATGLPIAGISGLGTGVGTALGNTLDGTGGLASHAGVATALPSALITQFYIGTGAAGVAGVGSTGTHLAISGGTLGTDATNAATPSTLAARDAGGNVAFAGLTGTSFTDSGLATQGVVCNSAAGLFSTSTAGCPNTLLTAALGGTGVNAPTAHAVLIGEGASAFGQIAIGTAGRMLLDQGAGADPAFAVMSGDATLASNGAIAVAKIAGVSPGTFYSQNYATPPAIGSTTPAAGSFSALTDTALAVAGFATNTSGGVFGTVAAALAADVRTGTDATKPVTSGALLGAQAKQTVTESANAATVNWQSGFNARIVLNGNLTTLTLSNPSDGLPYVLDIVQPGSGGPYTVTWPAAVDWGAAGSPTLSTAANARDKIVLTYDSAASKYDATIAQGY